MTKWLNNTKEFQSLPLYECLRIRRLVAGLTQKELSEQIDIPFSTLAHIETGRISIPRKHMLKVLTYLYGERYYTNGKEQ